ncbi:HAMP domain-containing sensor histidine kinase [Mammaliicoccus sp. Dog046]|uniref:sensor histidine kinase n=1 Tax=Mammaliicoccus sp. Dog046 TaxID=3034233 RepID=UPI002B259570|nr:HAMP domain-containing sensor histidine kinase [Mammaliicoccus sp. Dog046]WQK84528.1 HAMP domain-containing sensor histidine kinase [Mammaliicoccus sp. Dog046]
MKLGTKIQLYTTVMIVIVVICINLFVYFVYQKISLESEVTQLESRGINIMKELQDTTNSNVNSEMILQSHLLSDGYITVVNQDNKNIVQISTDVKYKNLAEKYKNEQYKKVVQKNGQHFAMVSLPIILESGEVSNLQIFENINFKYETFSILRWILIVSTFIILIVIFLLNRIITQIILKPINELIDQMNQTRETKHYNQIDINDNDTKELKELSHTFNEMMVNLKRHDEQQEAFILNASHELKTPITVMTSYSEMLKRFGKSRPDVLDEGIETINEESKRLKYLTEQMLDLAKIERSFHDVDFDELDVVEQVSRLSRRLARVYDRNIHINATEQPQIAKINKESFQQLLTIFIDNAQKYSQSDIDINIKDLGQLIEITIKDYGAGIPAEDVDKIFTRFYRVDKARSRKSGGSGLGLSIAKELALKNQIEIEVNSKVGEGTAFILKVKKV